MAKARKKTRKPARSAAKKRRAVPKSRAKPVRRKARRAKAKKPTSIIASVTGAVREMGLLRGRLGGHNSFEDD
jgi:hypothetical protein